MFALDSIADGLSLKWDGQLILEYHFQAGGNRSFIHPLRLPDSPSLSIDRAAAVPVDHLHHRGLWVAWKRVNGVNFWEQPERGEDPEGYGRIVHQDVTRPLRRRTTGPLRRQERLESTGQASGI